jgi:serine/threonine protein kinase
MMVLLSCPVARYKDKWDLTGQVSGYTPVSLQGSSSPRGVIMPAMAATGPTIGAVIGHYRIQRKLGQGGMGVVYLAEDMRLGRPVALKTLAREYADNPERRKRFLNEARAAAALNHVGIASVYELEEHGEDVFIIFEYVEGITLRALLQAGTPELDELLDITVQIATALEAAHAKGIVHRDLKPENVMRRPTGEVKVLDFGLARMESGVIGTCSTTQSYGLTQVGTVMGTVGYMSPEQLEGKPTDFRSDIFSFGVMLYELATGTHPFAGETPVSTIANVMTHEPPPLTSANTLHPPELERIARKCLRKSRDDRYQSTRDLVVDLKDLKHHSSSTSPAPPEPERRARVERTPQTWWLMHTSSYLVVGVPLLAYLGWQMREFAPPFGGFVFLAQALLLATQALFRIVGVFVWGLNRKELGGVWERLRRPLLFANFGIAATMLAQTVMLAMKDYLGLAALVGAFAMAAMVNAVFTEPALVPRGKTE